MCRLVFARHCGRTCEKFALVRQVILRGHDPKLPQVPLQLRERKDPLLAAYRLEGKSVTEYQYDVSGDDHRKLGQRLLKSGKQALKGTDAAADLPQ